MQRTKRIIFLFLSLYFGFAQAQTFDRIGTNQGIYQSIVYSITQDSSGNIWGATEEGIIRFNSKKTYLYLKNNGLPENALNRILTIYIDKNNTIWAGGESGLYQYQADKDEFIAIDFEKGKQPKTIDAIMEDADGNLWAGASNGIWKYEKNGEKAILKQVLNRLNVNIICVQNGQLVVGSDKGIYLLDVLTNEVQQAGIELLGEVKSAAAFGEDYLIGTRTNGLFKCSNDFASIEKITLPFFKNRNFSIQKILVDKNKGIYLGVDGAGLFYLNSQLEVQQHYLNDVNDPNSISSNGIYDLLLGDENLLWIATYGGGISRLDLAGKGFQSIQHRFNDKNSLAHNFTRAILEDKAGNIWYGTKEGISIHMKARNEWKHLPAPGNPTGSPDIILALKEDDDFVWAGTYGRGALKINKNNYSTTVFSPQSPAANRISLANIYAIHKDKKGNIWLGGINEDLHQIAPAGEISTYPISQIRAFSESKNGGIYVAGRSGVQLIRDGKIEQFEEISSGKNGLNYATISAIHESQNGTLTLATNGAGLVFYQPFTQKIQQLNTESGLPSDAVQSIIYENENQLWAGTTRGLVNVIFNEKDTLIKEYNPADGLPSAEFNYGSHAQLRDGRLAFGGTEGVSIFHPDRLRVEQEVPKVVFEEFRILNLQNEDAKSVRSVRANADKEIRLKHFENAINIQFAGILHSAPERVQYSWKMDGLNEQWSRPTTENQINFANLSPGKYVFQLKASNRDGLWSAPKSLSICIAPPWWATNLAQIIYVLLLVGLIVGAVYLASILLKKRNADEQIAFFNNITHELKTPLSILLSNLESTPNGDGQNDTNRKVKSTVKRLNTLFDQLLNFNKVTSGHYQSANITKIHLKSHIEQITESFRPLAKKRNLSISITDEWAKEVFYYDKNALDKIIFNLISNAVKYSKDDGNIIIKIQNGKKNDLQITVKDDGIGIPQDQQKYILKRYYRGRNAINSQTPGTGLGLMIIKNLVEKDDGNISFKSAEGEGTAFRVSLKNQQKHYVESVVSNTLVTPIPEADMREFNRINEFSDAKILIVEDNDELRQVLVDKIGTYFQVFEATNGREGLEQATQHFPDLILTDLIMPEMDGMAMARALQEDINMNHIPVFMMTVLNSSQNRIESIESGITAYMEKPINFEFLLAKMTSTLAWQKKMREKYLHQTETENAEKFRNERDSEFINSLEKFVLEKVKEETLSVHDLCRHVGMSRTALYMKLKSLVDLSPQNFIIHTRLKYARRLLVEGDVQIKEVAYIAGFSNPKYFSTSFKKLFGVSPTGFLKGLREE